MTNKKKLGKVSVKNLSHKKAVRKHIPTAEKSCATGAKQMKGRVFTYQRRDPELDPQLVWDGKYDGDAELKVPAPPLYIQEKIHPKFLIDDLMRETKVRADESAPMPPDLFADFNVLSGDKTQADYYKHDASWTNRMILGDSLQTMASLSENEGLKGKVQCIYIDPPYGIKFNSNFQWSTTDRDVQDGKRGHIVREPEQLKAFRDTWINGIHTYLSYLKDRLILSHELLHETGSIFVQIGDENVHRVRLLLDEVFGPDNFIREIFFVKTGSLPSKFIGRTGDRILWYGKKKEVTKSYPLFEEKLTDNYYKHLEDSESLGIRSLKEKEIGLPSSAFEGSILQYVSVEGTGKPPQKTPFEFQGKKWCPNASSHWSVAYPKGMERLAKSGRLVPKGKKLRYKSYLNDFPVKRIMDVWKDTSGFVSDQRYVVETRPKVIERCLLMSTDPGDIVLDPTCGSGTTAYVAEQWGRRWIAIDTSRVALALARARIMGARYPWYILADSEEGKRRQAEIEGREPEREKAYGNVRLGFVWERIPHVTLSTISNNAEIEVIWDRWRKILAPLRKQLNDTLGASMEEWEVPCEVEAGWSSDAKVLHKEWRRKLAERQKEMEASIASRAAYELRRDKPNEDDSIVRVAGPFTFETLSPHRMLSADENGEFFSSSPKGGEEYGERSDFVDMILNHLKVAGVQQVHKADRIVFTSIKHRPGKYLPLEGAYEKDGKIRRMGIFIGPEFGTVTQCDLKKAVKEAAESGFDIMLSLAFSYEAHVAEMSESERGGGGTGAKSTYEF